MKPEEIQRNNALIARFMGLELRASTFSEKRLKFWYETKFNMCIGKEHDLAYHSSWERLMPVVEKIWDKMHRSFVIAGSGCDWGSWCKVTFGKHHCLSENKEEMIHSNPHLELDTKLIDEVYKGVVKFIKHHNEEERK
jgi:hypothetical protein